MWGISGREHRQKRSSLAGGPSRGIICISRVASYLIMQVAILGMLVRHVAAVWLILYVPLIRASQS